MMSGGHFVLTGGFWFAPSEVVPPCPEDLDGDGIVSSTDLLVLLGAWGPNPGDPADFDGNGNVGASDLLALLANWG